MSTLSTVGIGVVWNRIASVLVKLCAFANIFIILRFLSVHDYGIIQLVLSVFTTVSGALLPGLGTVLISDMARYRGAGEVGKANALARQYLAMRLALGAVAAALLFFGSGLVAVWMHRPDLGYYIAIIAVLLFTNPLRSALTLLTSAHLNFKLQSVQSVLDEAAKLALIGILFYVFGISIAGALWAMALTPLAVVLLTLPWSWKLIRPVLTAGPTSEPWWCLLSLHRFWGMASSYITAMNQNIRLWLIQIFLGTEAVGLYSFAQGLVSQAIDFINVSAIINPVLANVAHDRTRLAAYGTRAFKYHLWLAIAALVPGLIVTPFFIMWFFPSYTGAIVLTCVSLLTFIPSVVNAATTALYSALQLQKEFFLRAGVLKTVTIGVLTVPLILAFGLTGTAAELITTNLISTLERVRTLRQLLPGFLPSLSSLSSFDATDRDLLQKIRARLPWRGINR